MIEVLQEVIDVNIVVEQDGVIVELQPVLLRNGGGSGGITRTSELINDGEDGLNPFITANDVPLASIDGGAAASIYLASQNIDGGNASTIYSSSDIIDGGNAFN